MYLRVAFWSSQLEWAMGKEGLQLGHFPHSWLYIPLANQTSRKPQSGQTPLGLLRSLSTSNRKGPNLPEEILTFALLFRIVECSQRRDTVALYINSYSWFPWTRTLFLSWMPSLSLFQDQAMKVFFKKNLRRSTMEDICICFRQAVPTFANFWSKKNGKGGEVNLRNIFDVVS